MKIRGRFLTCIITFIIQCNQYAKALIGALYIYRQWQLLFQRWKCTILSVAHTAAAAAQWLAGGRGAAKAFRQHLLSAWPTIIMPSKGCDLRAPALLCTRQVRMGQTPSMTSASAAASQIEGSWEQQLGEDFCPTSWEEWARQCESLGNFSTFLHSRVV